MYQKRNFVEKVKLAAALVLSLSLVLVSCSKDKEIIEDEEPPVGTEHYYKLHRINNLPTGSEESSVSLDNRPPIYLNFATGTLVDARYAKTSRWDMALGGMFNCYFSGNNGTNGTNLGFMGPGVGGIYIVDKPFDEVIEIPSDNLFQTAADVYGSDAAGNFGDRIGWFLYDFDGVIVSDGRPEKQHVAYALAEPLTLTNGKVLSPRTVIVRTAKGDYVKIKMISCYKDIYTQADWYINSPFIYFTFEYVVVPKGSNRFEIK
ncbi:HmuY family protein [Gynurincola endophyticus]|uniref:HmuY family protein n=1 Tax=Gynurincola endophyticus TaxID=2479004 RepID=UPI000F8DBA03|nr:HmuY family protein [Gynurincola endophyticus]